MLLQVSLSFRIPKLEYTILFNSSRALTFFQLVFGSPNKPDGRVGECVCVCTCTHEKGINFVGVYQQEIVYKYYNYTYSSEPHCVLEYSADRDLLNNYMYCTYNIAHS